MVGRGTLPGQPPVLRSRCSSWPSPSSPSGSSASYLSYFTVTTTVSEPTPPSPSATVTLTMKVPLLP